MAGAALQLLHPQIDTVGDFQQAQAGNNQLAAQKFEMAQAGLKQIGSMALGVMGGKLDGQADPAAWEQAMDMLGQTGFDVSGYKGRPDLAPILARASLDTMGQINAAQNERELDLRMQEFEQKIADAAAGGGEDFGLNPIAGTVDGKPVFIQPGNKGGTNVLETPEGFTPRSRYEKFDLGTEWLITDTTTGLSQRIPKENEKAARDTARGKGEGELDAELPGLKSKAQSTMAALDTQRKIVTNDIDRAVKAITGNPWFTTGAGAAVTAWAPGSPGQAVAEMLKSVKANIGFDKLQQMRENSPTGGALGQVSDFENRQLQTVMGSLEQSNNTPDLLYNLRRLQDVITEMQTARADAFQRDFGEAGMLPEQGAGGDDVVDWTDMF